MCMSSSTPSEVVILTACIVSNNISIVPSAGAYILPSAGIIATPFPKISSPKVGSLTLLIATVFPFTGEPISIPFSFFLKNQTFPHLFSAVLLSGLSCHTHTFYMYRQKHDFLAGNSAAIFLFNIFSNMFTAFIFLRILISIILANSISSSFNNSCR